MTSSNQNNIPTGHEKLPERSSFVAYGAPGFAPDGTGLYDPATKRKARLLRTDNYGSGAGPERPLTHIEVFKAAGLALPGVSVVLSYEDGVPESEQADNLRKIHEAQNSSSAKRANRWGAVIVHGATPEEFEASVQEIVDRVDHGNGLASVRLS